MEPADSNPKQTIFDKFPKLRPIKSAPALFRINGCGVGVYGKRDHDPETGSYVKTHCLCLVFIPLVAIGAYRVVDAPNGGWYFLGKENLSKFAFWWNGLIALMVWYGSLSLAWDAHTSTPEYKARQELKQAGKLLEAKDYAKAAMSYRHVINSGQSVVLAVQGFQAAFDQSLQSGSPAAIETMYHILTSFGQPASVVPDAFKRGLPLVEKWRSTDPEAALRLFDELGKLDPKNASLPPLQIDLLKQAIAAKADNTNRAVELALIYETAQQLDDSRKVLEPFQKKLGATEGARILGQALLQENRHEEAYALLYPYVQSKLDHLHAVEKNYTNSVQAAYRRHIKALEDGQGDPSFYEKYKAASKTDKDTMVNDYLQRSLEHDPAYLRAVSELRAANKIVHVTLDLGIVQLNRAQNLSDPAGRRAELEAAEKTFLAIGGLAGKSDEYRLFLGQVYYWLGKSAEGRQLFDALLGDSHRAYPILMALARTLRDVGEAEQSRGLAEEAYKIAANPKDKFHAAAFRSITQRDLDDQIAWLEKSDPDGVETQINLNSARAEKALEQGNKPGAAQFVRKAIAGYQNMEKNSTALNNCGLCYFTLYRVTGSAEDYDHGLSMLGQAVDLAPSDSVLLINTMEMLLSGAIMDLVRDSFQLDALAITPGPSMLRVLYHDEAGRQQLYRQLRENPKMQKALAYLDKAMLLAPKDLDLYRVAAQYHGEFRDLDQLKRVQQRMRAAALDMTASAKETLKSYRGDKDQENLTKVQTSIRKYQDLLKTPAVMSSAPTREYTAVTLNELEQTSAFYGGAQNSGKLLQEARAIYDARQSSYSSGGLIAAYGVLACDELGARDPQFASLAGLTKRSLSKYQLLLLVLERGGPLGERARQNQNVIKLLELEKQMIAQFPPFRDTMRWAAFHNVDPDIAAGVVQAYKSSELARDLEDLAFQLNPLQAATVLDYYWYLKLMGEEKKAIQIYQDAIQKGVPLPPLG